MPLALQGPYQWLLDHLYDELPKLMAPTIFSSDKRIDIRRPHYGPTSGVRGAARLWKFS